jgi:hypothetical protein
MSRLLNIKFDLTGVEEVLAALDQAEESIRATVKSAMQDNVAHLQEASVALAPILSSNLRDSVSSEVNDIPQGVEGTVAFGTVYALRRHEEEYKPGPITAQSPGYDGMKPGRKYLERPLKRYSRKYMEHIANKVKEALR